MFPFGLLSVISKDFVAAFEHVFFCWKRYSTKTIVALTLKKLAQQTNIYSNSTAETLKAEQLVAYLSLCSNIFCRTMNMYLFLLLRFLFRCIYCQF